MRTSFSFYDELDPYLRYKTMKRTLPFLLAALFSSIGPSLFSQEKGIGARGELRSFASFTGDDLLLGGGGGLQILDGSYRGGLAFLFRPSYAPRVHEEERGSVQYQEKRYAGLLYIERCFVPEFLGEWEAHIGMSGGVAVEERRGFPNGALIRGIIVPRAGIGYPLFKGTRLEGEYRYSPSPALNAREHRIGLRFLVEL